MASDIFEADAAMRIALEKCLKAGGSPRRYGGVLCDPDGSKAWLTFRIVNSEESARLKNLGNSDLVNPYNAALDDAIDEIRKKWRKVGLPLKLENILTAIRGLRK